MAGKRVKYSPEFKEAAVGEVIKEFSSGRGRGT